MERLEGFEESFQHAEDVSEKARRRSAAGDDSRCRSSIGTRSFAQLLHEELAGGVNLEGVEDAETEKMYREKTKSVAMTATEHGGEQELQMQQLEELQMLQRMEELQGVQRMEALQMQQKTSERKGKGEKEKKERKGREREREEHRGERGKGKIVEGGRKERNKNRKDEERRRERERGKNLTPAVNMRG